MADNSLVALRQTLGDWYKSEDAAGRHHTRIQNITMGMLGSASQPQCDLHGAETNGMLAFANSFLLVRFGHLLGERRPHFTSAASNLVNLLDALREYPRVVPRWDGAAFLRRGLVSY